MSLLVRSPKLNTEFEVGLTSAEHRGTALVLLDCAVDPSQDAISLLGHMAV